MFLLRDFGVLFGHMIACCICYRQVVIIKYFIFHRKPLNCILLISHMLI